MVKKVEKEEGAREAGALLRDAGGSKTYGDDHCLLDDGSEHCGGEPSRIPARLLRTMNRAGEVQRLVREELSRLKAAEGYETFEEADDFDCGDDQDLSSPYELDDEVSHEYGDERRSDRKAGSAGIS